MYSHKILTPSKFILNQLILNVVSFEEFVQFIISQLHGHDAKIYIYLYKLFIFFDLYKCLMLDLMYYSNSYY